MNNVSLTGRLTREPELRYGGQDNSTAITRFTLAIDDGKDTDFINIKCFGRTAEWAQKWLSKGSKAEEQERLKQAATKAREQAARYITQRLWQTAWDLERAKQRQRREGSNCRRVTGL